MLLCLVNYLSPFAARKRYLRLIYQGKPKKKKTPPPFAWVNPLPEERSKNLPKTLKHGTFKSLSMKVDVGSLDDARLFYRISCKGPAALILPRQDDPAWIEENVVPPYTSPPSVLNVK